MQRQNVRLIEKRIKQKKKKGRDEDGGDEMMRNGLVFPCRRVCHLHVQSLTHSRTDLSVSIELACAKCDDGQFGGSDLLWQLPNSLSFSELVRRTC